MNLAWFGVGAPITVIWRGKLHTVSVRASGVDWFSVRVYFEDNDTALSFNKRDEDEGVRWVRGKVEGRKARQAMLAKAALLK